MTYNLVHSLKGNEMQSDKIVVASPMSYAGSAERIWNLTEILWVRLFVLVPLIGMAWLLITAWYVTLVVFMGVLFVPYRLIRRGQRKRKVERLRHRELLEAVKKR